MTRTRPCEELGEEAFQAGDQSGLRFGVGKGLVRRSAWLLPCKQAGAWDKRRLQGRGGPRLHGFNRSQNVVWIIP